MNFPTAVKSGFRNYATFSGRATRSEFWWFVLFAQLLQAIGQSISTELATLLWLAAYSEYISACPKTSRHWPFGQMVDLATRFNRRDDFSSSLINTADRSVNY